MPPLSCYNRPLSRNQSDSLLLFNSWLNRYLQSLTHLSGAEGNHPIFSIQLTQYHWSIIICLKNQLCLVSRVALLHTLHLSYPLSLVSFLRPLH